MIKLKDFSLYILDLAQNSLRADATWINIFIDEREEDNLLVVEIEDNGKGMSDEELDKVLNPFYTTRTTRRIGLGLSLFTAMIKRCDGELCLSSTPGEGTKLTAIITLNHWDKPPLGDMAGSLVTLIAGNPEVDFVYQHRRGSKDYLLETKKVKGILEDVPINNPTVLDYIQKDIEKGLLQIESWN